VFGGYRVSQSTCALTTPGKLASSIDFYLARRGVLTANAIQKLENYRDKTAGTGQLP
jgi:hypothetical protein